MIQNISIKVMRELFDSIFVVFGLGSLIFSFYLIDLFCEFLDVFFFH